MASVRSEHTDSSTLEMVSAGLQFSFRISRQMCPCELMLQWYILVRNMSCARRGESGSLGRQPLERWGGRGRRGVEMPKEVGSGEFVGVLGAGGWWSIMRPRLGAMRREGSADA